MAGDGQNGIRRRLAAKLVDESEAYGFSLTTWGVGALVIDHFGIPPIGGVLAFLAGAVSGFALLALIAFGELLGETQVTSGSLLVVSMVHVVSTIGTVLACEAVLRLLAPLFPRLLTFFVLGALLTVLYNTLLMAEEFAGRKVE